MSLCVSRFLPQPSRASSHFFFVQLQTPASFPPADRPPARDLLASFLFLSAFFCRFSSSQSSKTQPAATSGTKPLPGALAWPESDNSHLTLSVDAVLCYSVAFHPRSGCLLHLHCLTSLAAPLFPSPTVPHFHFCCFPRSIVSPPAPVTPSWRYRFATLRLAFVALNAATTTGMR